MKVTVMSNIVGALGSNPKKTSEEMGKLEIRGRIDTV